MDWEIWYCVSAPGDVVDKVKIERENLSTVVFTEGARNAYLGYVTIKVRRILRIYDVSYL